MSGLVKSSDSASNVFKAHWSDVVESDVNSVWEIISDFNGLSRLSDGVASSTLIGDLKSGELGCLRHLVMADGQWVDEELVEFDVTTWRLSYIIVNGSIPVTGYRSTIQLFPVKESNCTFVDWVGFFSPIEGGPAGEELQDAVSQNVYRATIQGLKSTLQISDK